MKIVLFAHPSGRLAVQPLAPHPPTVEALRRLLQPIPGRRWHADEHLWTLPFEGPWAAYFLTVLVRQGFQPSPEGLPQNPGLRRLARVVCRPRRPGLTPPAGGDL